VSPYDTVRSQGRYPCTGCGVCAAACPSGAIAMVVGHDGFLRPIVYDDRCSHCGLCVQVCAKFHREDDGSFLEALRTDGHIFAATSLDEDTRRSSASGGAGFELARFFLAQGYAACGVRYNAQEQRAEHFVARELAAFEDSKGSKYLQSHTVQAFRSLCDGSRYIVFGTPCQIYGIRRWVRTMGIEERVLLVDLFCHGVPSYGIWRKYLHQIIGDVAGEAIASVSFRRPGWGHSMRVEKPGFVYQGAFPKDHFLYLYLQGVGLMDCCYDCGFHENNCGADIRLGDFWGPRFEGDTKGVSLVVARTAAGLDAVRSLSASCRVQTATFDELIASQYGPRIKPVKCHARLLSAFADSDRTIGAITWQFRGPNRARLLARAALLRWTPRGVKTALKRVLGRGA